MDGNGAGLREAAVQTLWRLYGPDALATFTTLGVLAWRRGDPAVASVDTWVHAGIVCAFAVLRRAAAGQRAAGRRLRIVSVMLPAISRTEGCIPGLFPTSMRVEQLL